MFPFVSFEGELSDSEVHFSDALLQNFTSSSLSHRYRTQGAALSSSFQVFFTRNQTGVTKNSLRAYSARHGNSDDEQGHSIAYYEQYRKMFQSGNPFVSDTHPSEDQITTVPNESSELHQNDQTNGSSFEPLLTHTDAAGKVKMVDVGFKAESQRSAKACGKIRLREKTFRLVKENKMKKGDVLSVAQIAGIMAAKQTSVLIPLCHPIPLNKIDVALELDEDNFAVSVTAEVSSFGKTGVEMEALTAVTVSLLTVYDMCKAVSHDMELGDVKLLSKRGGQRGDFQRCDS